ncbi:unknown [Clostridium sp. CAG:967]|nr:unknown [Clostridium sp. CAG:967]
MTNFTLEKSKQIALARLDLIHKWLEFRKKYFLGWVVYFSCVQ